jgi:hypothetical protein
MGEWEEYRKPEAGEVRNDRVHAKVPTPFWDMSEELNIDLVCIMITDSLS